MVNEYVLLNFFMHEPAYGKIALEGKVNEAIMNLGHNRKFFRSTNLDYTEPDFALIGHAVRMYRKVMGQNAEQQ